MADATKPRVPSAPVDPQFPDRWSPRAFTARRLTPDEVASLLEAMRWAPSCYNEQPWLLVHAFADEDLERMRPVLMDANRRWADRAPFLAVLFARRTFARNGKENRHAAHDCGAAWMSLALQARHMGLHAHAMAGFSRKRAYEILGVPEGDYEALTAIAVGELGDPAILPDDLRQLEQPNERVPVASWAPVGRFVAEEER